MSTKVAFISQPMSGLTDEQILAARDAAKEILEDMGYTVLDSFIKDEIKAKNQPLAYLARSLSIMAQADAVYFITGYENARGCLIEERCAKDYGITCIYETNR